jgi:hypothetical protein
MELIPIGDEDYAKTASVLAGQARFVGLRGLEPLTSSLSAITR